MTQLFKIIILWVLVNIITLALGAIFQYQTAHHLVGFDPMIILAQVVFLLICAVVLVLKKKKQAS